MVFFSDSLFVPLTDEIIFRVTASLFLRLKDGIFFISKQLQKSRSIFSRNRSDKDFNRIFVGMAKKYFFGKSKLAGR